MTYIYRKLSECEPVPCPCGESTRIIQAKDTPVANLHVTRIRDSTKHYHKHATEYYYILEGAGKMELDEETVDLEPGVTIVIPPGTRHRAWGEIAALIVGVPAWDPADEWFD